MAFAVFERARFLRGPLASRFIEDNEDRQPFVERIAVAKVDVVISFFPCRQLESIRTTTKFSRRILATKAFDSNMR